MTANDLFIRFAYMFFGFSWGIFFGYIISKPGKRKRRGNHSETMLVKDLTMSLAATEAGNGVWLECDNGLIDGRKNVFAVTSAEVNEYGNVFLHFTDFTKS